MLVGCICDDFIGSCDVANTLARGRRNSVLTTAGNLPTKRVCHPSASLTLAVNAVMNALIGDRWVGDVQ
jgi:hypothetical protein